MIAFVTEAEFFGAIQANREDEKEDVEENYEGNAADDSPASLNASYRIPHPICEKEKGVGGQQHHHLINNLLYAQCPIFVWFGQQEVVDDESSHKDVTEYLYVFQAWQKSQYQNDRVSSERENDWIDEC